MAQGPDYTERIRAWKQSNLEAETNRVEGFSMGAATAANALAYSIKNPHDTYYAIKNPTSLLYCAGYTHGLDIIEENISIFRYLLGAKMCALAFMKWLIPCRDLVRGGISFGAFPHFNPCASGEHPIQSLQIIASQTNIPLIFVHSRHDQRVSFIHALRNYLAAITARRSTNNIYLLLVDYDNEEGHMGLREDAETFWSTPCIKIRDASYAEKHDPSIGAIVMSIYQQDKSYDLHYYQPDVQRVEALLHDTGYYATLYSSWLCKAALISIVALRYGWRE